ncbi:MAG TPA: hypothetical protein EYP65_04090, partial [Armatimonadetes bacterium]|nr:hypothetical protein [Armatimonadota bacterium]
MASTLHGPVGGGPWEAVLAIRPPGPPFVEVGHRPEGWPPPEPTRAERRAGFIPFLRPNPSDFRPWSRPKEGERAYLLKAFAALGEVEPLWVGIYALDNLKGVRAEVGGLKGPGRIPAENIALRVLRFWPQMAGWRSKAYRIVPELLPPLAPFDLPEGATAVLWLTIKVPERSRPGRYVGWLRVWAEGRPPLRLRLEMRVLPFRLERPPKRWLLYADLLPPWRPTDKMPDSGIRADLRDMREHGVDGLVDFVRGRWEFKGGREVSFEVDELSGRIWGLVREEGFRGPFVFSINPLEEALKALSVPPPGPERRWPRPLLSAVKEAYKAVREALSRWGMRWLLYAADEPQSGDLKALQLYECAKKAGLLTFVTLNSPEFAREADRWIDVRCYNIRLLCRDEEGWRRLVGEVRRAGDRLWLYGSGSYPGQEGEMAENRYLAGFLFWKSGAEAMVSWTYQRTFGKDPYDEFSEGKFACLTYPDFGNRPDWSTYRGPIPTIQWEGLREGIDDACYVYTLLRYIERAKRKGKGRAAREAEEELRLILEALPWVGEFSERPLSNEDLNKMRWALAVAIEELHSLLEEGKVRFRPGLSPSAVPVRLS